MSDVRDDLARERQARVSAPARAAVSRPSAGEATPEQRFGLRNADVRNRAGLTRLDAIACRSRTFREAQAKLAEKRVNVTVALDSLPPKKGGGTTQGTSPSYRILLDPKTVADGSSILDVFLHEWGHVLEDEGLVERQAFVNAVQAELGIRQTPDSHAAGEEDD